MLQRIGERCEGFVRRYMPDPFVLVLLLTIATVGLALWVMPVRPNQILNYWYEGFWELLSFAMQMVLIVVTGEAIAETQLIQKTLKKICAIPKTAYSAIVLLTLISIFLGWLHWGFGLVTAS